MFRVRYVLAVLVGLAMGVAAGWASGRGFDSADPVATTGAHTGHQAARATTPPRPRSDANPRPVRPPQSFPVPNLQQVQQRLMRCLYGSSTWRQQVVCLRAVLRLKAAGSRSLAFSFAGLPFRLVGQPFVRASGLRRYRGPIVASSQHTIRAYSTTTVRARTDSPHNT
jgi:hypothetical protein